MGENRRFYWLKLHKDFFKSKRIKKLRNLAGGDTYTIIYLKMQLLSLEDNGYLYFTGLEKTFAEELALDLDESPDDVGIVCNYLQTVGLLEKVSEDSYLLPFVQECTGSETASTIRSQKSRAAKALQCNTDATLPQHNCNGEIEIDIEKDIDIDIKGASPKKPKGFRPPTLDEVRAYCMERGNNVDAEKFIDFYTSNGWKVGKNSMKDWKAAVRTWERNGYSTTSSQKQETYGERRQRETMEMLQAWKDQADTML